jgi:hypothetical protein
MGKGKVQGRDTDWLTGGTWTECHALIAQRLSSAVWRQCRHTTSHVGDAPSTPALPRSSWQYQINNSSQDYALAYPNLPYVGSGLAGP